MTSCMDSFCNVFFQHYVLKIFPFWNLVLMAVKFLLTVVFSLVCLVFVLTTSAAIHFPGHVSLCMCARTAGYRLYIFNLIRCRKAVHRTVRVFVWAQVLTLSFTLCVALPLWLCLLISKTTIVVVITYGRLFVVLQYQFSLLSIQEFQVYSWLSRYRLHFSTSFQLDVATRLHDG